jgi:FkbM family methyltransferase
MSRTMARALRTVVRLATGMQSPVRRAMTRARLVDLLHQDGAEAVETSRRSLSFLTSRGPHLAAAAVKFHAEEPETLAWIDGFRAGEVFWDVGAATGLFSIYAATIPGVAVWAFEPKATSFGVLVEHLALNGLGEQVTPLPIAFSDGTGITRIGLADLAPAGATTPSRPRPSPRRAAAARSGRARSPTRSTISAAPSACPRRTT